MTQLQDSDPALASNANEILFEATSTTSRGGYVKLFIGIGVGIAIALIGSRFLGTASNASRPEPAAESATPVSAQTVTAVPVTISRVQERLTVTGTVQPTDLLEVTPQIGGLKIREVLVDEGDRVAAGQPMVILDDAELQTQIQQARAQIQEAEAQKTVAQAQVNQEKANLAQSEAAQLEAEANLQRYRDLVSQGAVSDEEFDSRDTEAVTAQEAVRVAKANITSAEANVASAAATVRSRQSELDRWQTQFAFTTVNAPADGIVAERLASVGDVSSTSSAVITLIRNNQLELAAEVPQAQLAQVQVGAPAIITSSTDPSIRATGTVQEIQPLVDPQTRVAQVIIRLPSSDRLRSGMFLTANLQVGERSGLTIPASAVLTQADGSVRVYVLGPDNTAVARTIEAGTRPTPAENEVALVEILQGLEVGEQVIVAGASYVQEGDVVTVAE